jgi:hypothetical protein
MTALCPFHPACCSTRRLSRHCTAQTVTVPWTDGASHCASPTARAAQTLTRCSGGLQLCRWAARLATSSLCRCSRHCRLQVPLRTAVVADRRRSSASCSPQGRLSALRRLQHLLVCRDAGEAREAADGAARHRDGVTVADSLQTTMACSTRRASRAAHSPRRAASVAARAAVVSTSMHRLAKPPMTRLKSDSRVLRGGPRAPPPGRSARRWRRIPRRAASAGLTVLHNTQRIHAQTRRSTPLYASLIYSPHTRTPTHLAATLLHGRAVSCSKAMVNRAHAEPTATRTTHTHTHQAISQCGHAL